MIRTGVLRWAAAAAALCVVAAVPACRRASGLAPGRGGDQSSPTAAVQRGTFLETTRITGTTEAVRAAVMAAPRLAGQASATLVITKLIKSGSRVKAGDVLVEFDSQDQVRAAFDRRTDFQDLEQQVSRLEAEQAAAYAGDETAMLQAQNDVGRAELEARKNRVLPPIEAEKNNLSQEEAQARLVEVREARTLRRRTAAADLKILQIRRERLERALHHAEQNAEFMVVRAPFDGLAIVQHAFKGSSMAEVQEGDEVRPGMPIVSVVDPSTMQVRARVNQADANLVAAGQPVRLSLDAYPGLLFDGSVRQVAPLAITSSITPVVRSFVAIVAIRGADASLMPDLSAAADVVVRRRDGVLVLPRDAVVIDRTGAWVRVQKGLSFQRQSITTGEVSAEQVVVAAGLPEGTAVARRAAGGK
jgi:HlyD family secretion protein